MLAAEMIPSALNAGYPAGDVSERIEASPADSKRAEEREKRYTEKGTMS